MRPLGGAYMVKVGPWWVGLVPRTADPIELSSPPSITWGCEGERTACPHHDPATLARWPDFCSPKRWEIPLCCLSHPLCGALCCSSVNGPHRTHRPRASGHLWGPFFCLYSRTLATSLSREEMSPDKMSEEFRQKETFICYLHFWEVIFSEYRFLGWKDCFVLSVLWRELFLGTLLLWETCPHLCFYSSVNNVLFLLSASKISFYLWLYTISLWCALVSLSSHFSCLEFITLLRLADC